MTEEALFHAALSKPAFERAGFLAEACAGNDGLRRRVEALLHAHDHPAGFMAQPPHGELAGADGPISPFPSESPGSRIGPYKLLEQIGEGGMGVVFLAEQTSPVRRQVAIKVIKQGMDTRQVIARFEAERQALAMMDHPNIARVLDAGTTDTGRPYFVMELVKGVAITRFCDEQRLPPRQRLELFVQVCRAVQHAHTKGVIHRDLKPTNVLVALYDQLPVPKVIDFGVAKAAGPALTERTMFTGFGALVGTLEYMSPEQAQLNQLDVDTRSDVYALGVLLYELLTGTTPLTRERFRTEALQEALRIIREEEPPKPSTRLGSTSAAQLPAIAASRGVPPAELTGVVRGELDWIAMKALEKDRNRRYDSAGSLATDVQRYLGDEAVLACPPSAAYRFRKYARRHRVALGAAAAIACMLVVATAVSLRQAARAGTAERSARRNAAELALDKGQLLGESGDANLALLWLSRSLTLAPEDATDLRGAILLSMGSWQDRVNRLRWMLPHDHPVFGVAFASDGKLVTVSRKGDAPETTVRRWHAISGTEDGPPLPLPVDISGIVTLSPAGDALAFSSDDGSLTLIELPTGLELPTGRPARLTPPDPTVSPSCVAFSPDGKYVLVGYQTGKLEEYRHTGAARLYERTTGTPVGPPIEHVRPVFAAAFHPDGKSFVTECGTWGDAGEAVEARFFDLKGKPTRPPLPHPCMTPSVAFSPDGRTLLTGHWDRAARLWDLSADRSVAPIVLPHEGPVKAVAFSPDGLMVMTGSYDGSVRRWDASTGRALGQPLRQGHMVQDLCFSADGRQILTGSRGGVVRLWELAPAGPVISRLPQPTTTAFPLAVSPDRRTILTQDPIGHAVHLRDAATNALVGQPLLHGGPITIAGTSVPQAQSACSSDRRRAFTVADGAHATLWDAQTGQAVRPLTYGDSEAPFVSAAFSPDNKWLITGSHNGRADIRDASTGELARPVRHTRFGPVFNIAFAGDDGRTLLTAGADCAVRFWNIDTGEELGQPLMHHTPVFALALSPDGQTVITGDVDRDVLVWDLPTRRRRLSLTGHQGGVYDATFSADGRLILTASHDGTARLWDVTTGKPIGPPMLHPGPVIRVAFSRDGRTIQTALQDQTAFEWPVPVAVAGSPAELALWADVMTGTELGPDGALQILDAGEWAKRHRKLAESGRMGGATRR